jgi:glycerate-2-kinase
METPKVLSNCHNHLICNNKVALTAMARKVQKMGFVPCVITAEQTGNTSTVAQSRAGEILKGKYSGYDMLLIGGETTLTLPDSPGKGGRNQHYAAVSMLSLADYSGEWLVASVATDGSDYLPGVAGAIVDGSSLRSAHEKGLNVNAYIERFDSNSLLAEIGGSLIKMDNSGTNVADVILYIMR